MDVRLTQKCNHCTQIYGDTSSCAGHKEDAPGTHTEVPEKIKKQDCATQS